jgi:hypothetical protein
MKLQEVVSSKTGKTLNELNRLWISVRNTLKDKYPLISDKSESWYALVLEEFKSKSGYAGLIKESRHHVLYKHLCEKSKELGE